MKNTIQIKQLTGSELEDITRIQRECYPDDLIESAESFAAKISAHPDFCFMVIQDNVAKAYIIALPWIAGKMLELDSSKYKVPPEADCVYIHDIAVAPAARSFGVSRKLLNAVLDAALEKGYKRVCLVAVEGAEAYWERHGFEVWQADAELRNKLAAYGESATYMTAEIARDWKL